DYPPDRPSASGSRYAAAAPRRLSRPRNGQALRLPDQRLSPFGQNHRRAVQRALANRAVLQVDQTEPEDQSLCRDEPQRRNDPDLDRVVRQPLGGLFEVHQPVCVLRAAAPASAAAQPLCETKPLRTPLSTATAISPPEATPAGAALNLWDSSGSDPFLCGYWGQSAFWLSAPAKRPSCKAGSRPAREGGLRPAREEALRPAREGGHWPTREGGKKGSDPDFPRGGSEPSATASRPHARLGCKKGSDPDSLRKKGS